MGSCCHDGCFGGFRHRHNPRPDTSPRQSTGRVETIEEALKLERRSSGTWVPKSPSKDVYKSQESVSWTNWASPVPRSRQVSGSAASVDFELCIEEAEGGGSSHPVNIDTDRGLITTMNVRSKFGVEQLLASPGFLPKPMTARQREDTIRRVMPTATHEMLAKLPLELLSSTLPETQELRRKLAKGATVVFISAGLQGKKFTFQRAAALGVKAVIIEHPDSWSSSLVDEGIVAKFIPIDMSQSSELIFNEAMRCIQDLGNDGEIGAVDGIATFVELSVPLVSRLCEALGLPGHTPASVDSARNKHSTRAALRQAGLPTPRNALIRSEADLAVAAREVGFPAVIKPVSGAASLGVKKVSSTQDLEDCFREVVADLSTLVVSSGALIKGDASNAGVSANLKIDLTLLMEQYLDGCEVDVDVVMTNGEWVYAAVADNGPTLEPYFNETWAVCPSLLPREQQVALKELAVGCVKALGFDSGVFHVECKYTSTGPQLIEVNARMGGGQVHECNLRTWGVDLVEETIFAALGIPAGPNVAKMPLEAVAYCYVNAKRSGTVTNMSGLEALFNRDGVVWAKPLVRIGAHVCGPDDGMPTWLCDLLVTAPTAKEALEFLHRLEDEELVEVQ